MCWSRWGMCSSFGLTAAEQVVRRQLIADLAARDSAVVGDEQKEA